MPTAEEIPRFIDTQIKPHLNKILRVLGNERPASPLQFIADCFVSSSIPERGHPRAWEESDPKMITDSDEVKLLSFTTKVHKVDAAVSYKVD